MTMSPCDGYRAFGAPSRMAKPTDQADYRSHVHASHHVILIQQYATLHPSRSLPPTLKGCWHSQGSPSGGPLALKPQQQHQQRQNSCANYKVK